MTSRSAVWSCTLSAERSSQASHATAPSTPPGSGAPPAPPAAQVLFGSRLPLAEAYAAMLAGDGVQRGLIGPREAVRLWERHLLNCAVIAEAFPVGARVVDVGTGAGLPGLVLACVRLDLSIDLVESLQRRTHFLTEAVDALGFGARVRVITGRAEDLAVREQVGNSRWVTARAVAPLERLAGWCLPLLASGGTLVAMKGASAADEVSRSISALHRLGAASTAVVDYGVGIVDPATRTVQVVRR